MELSSQSFVLFVVALIILATGAVVMAQFRTMTQTTNAASNDSITTADTTYQWLTHPDVVSGTVTVYNETTALDTTQWNMTSYDETVGKISVNQPSAPSFNVSYTYVVHTGPLNITEKGLIGLSATSGMTGPLGIVVVAAIIITMIGGIIVLLHRG